jgi:hypothetical protein
MHSSVERIASAPGGLSHPSASLPPAKCAAMEKHEKLLGICMTLPGQKGDAVHVGWLVSLDSIHAC